MIQLRRWPFFHKFVFFVCCSMHWLWLYSTNKECSFILVLHHDLYIHPHPRILNTGNWHCWKTRDIDKIAYKRGRGGSCWHMGMPWLHYSSLKSKVYPWLVWIILRPSPHSLFKSHVLKCMYKDFFHIDMDKTTFQRVHKIISVFSIKMETATPC